MTTSVTNMDIHDISRTARTYCFERYFLVTPLEDQRKTVERILDHWRQEQSRAYHPDRFEALSLARIVPSFQEVLAQVDGDCHQKGLDPQAAEVVLTDARPVGSDSQKATYAELRQTLTDPLWIKRPLVLVFGTGWGVSPDFFPVVDRILAPIYGPEGEGGYNHLSVRSAVAIILDRLLGQ